MKMPNTLVVPVDTQIDFVMRQGLLAVKGAERIVLPGIRFLAQLDPDEIAGVLFTHDTHTREDYMGSLENLGNEETGTPGFEMHCEKNTPGWENVFNPTIVPASIPVHRLEKDVFDMWEKPSDETLVYEIDRPGQNVSTIGRERDSYFKHILPPTVDTIRIFGVASDFCVRWAIAGFLKRGYKVEVVGDLTAGIQRDIERTIVDEFTGQVLVI